MTTTWINIAKASGTGWTGVPAPITSVVGLLGGMPIGLLLALTYTQDIPVQVDPWTDITKASGTSWTGVPKAT